MLFGMKSNLYGYGTQVAIADGNSSILAQNMAIRFYEVAPVFKNNIAVNGKRSSLMKNNCINKIVRDINRR